MSTSGNPLDHGYLTGVGYAEKYRSTRNTVHRWGAHGFVPRIKWGGRWLYADEPPRLQGKALADHLIALLPPGHRLCSVCRRPFDPSGSTPSGWTRRKCRECINVYARAGTGKLEDRACLQREAEAHREIALADARGLSERAQRIEKHASRIRLMGLAGNGKDWANFELEATNA